MTSIARAIRAAILTADPRAKVMATRAIARDWAAGRLAPVYDVAMPDAPARPERPELRAPNAMPRRGRGGSERGRIALIHALCHIEFVAIDLALDAAGRFGAERGPRFVTDWLGVAADEAMHFALLSRRLITLGSEYGAMPAHDGLWDAARDTAHDVMARLAIVPMVLEARGLDVTPVMIERFTAAGDMRTTRILQRILDDESAMSAWVQAISAHCVRSAAKPRRWHGKRLLRATFAARLSHRSTTRRVVQPVCRMNSCKGLPESGSCP